MDKSQELRNVRIWVVPSPDSADFRLIVNVVQADGTPGATIGSCGHLESDKLSALLHAYRMGQRHANP